MINWKDFCDGRCRLTDNFIREFKDNVDWDFTSKEFDDLPEAFMMEFKDKPKH